MRMLALDLLPESLRHLDAKYPDILEHIECENPTLQKDGDAWCCLSGSNPQSGIFGCGPDPEKAVEDWEKDWWKRNTKAR